MAARVNFTLYRGTAPRLRFGPVLDENGNVLDLAGMSAVWTVRTSSSAPDPVVLQKAASIYGASADGIWEVALTKAETLTFAVRNYKHSLERDNPGFEDLFTIGVMTVALDVKNAAGV